MNARGIPFMLACTLTVLFGCSQKQSGQDSSMISTRDPHSFAKPDEVVVTHLYLDVSVDFEKQRLWGTATLSLNNKTGSNKLFLDTRDLTIERVTLGKEGPETPHSLGDVVQFLGQALTIDITPQTKEVTIAYHTNPNAAALQWLEPSQTAGGKKPFLFTQSQAILARTWVPCQDGPGVRMTYNARVKTRPDLMAVMSATNPTVKTEDGVYEFSMPQPIPSYLLALAVGDLAFKSTGPRSGVYAEPSMVDKAAWELEDTEKMIEAAESLYGPYRWDRYDVIVLPPSFPFGGMENPRLTFATPTILAGDRSLVALVAHELAHSWSGNLVTNATWNDFWLNEGFTVYFEHRIMEQVYGRTYAEMLAQLSMQDLQAAINDLGATNPDTHLKLNLGGRDPDEGMTDIAYNKGYFFLRLIEETVGREKWDAFLKSYFDAFAFKTMTTEGFISYLRENLIRGDKNLEEKIPIDRWVSGPGLPEGAPEVRSGEFGRVEEQLNAWKNGALARTLATKDWTTHHWLHFLRNLPSELSPEQMADLDKSFAFSLSGNSEILAAWFPHVIAHSYQPGYTPLEKFLMGVGRRKFLKPLYTKLAETPEGLERGRQIYRKARPGYHSVSSSTIDAILKWDER